uniref:alpha/beta hydrolase family protein n=1 Tax=Marinobacterium profundum TaxID=1714300 RepID=UPI0008306DA6|nr:alpha/beta hydrolase [Marinobacterium profundum]
MDTQRIEIEVSGRNFVFYFTPAQDKDKPILFIFHGHGYSSTPSGFKSPNWNVVCPMDNYGYEGLGSWYLGESGDLFWVDAMAEILRYVREYAGNGRLYMWGSSMGGYASILYGHLLGARAIYANVPQTLLLGSKYSCNGMFKFFSPIFNGNEQSEYNDLKKILILRTSCKYFLCFNQLEGSNYLSEQGLDFITHLHSFKQPMYVEIRPQSAHGKNHGVSEAISLFKKYN